MKTTGNGRIGIIGGSGVQVDDLFSAREWLSLETPYGAPSERYALGLLGGREIVFLHRHGGSRGIPPHRINYRANINGLQQLGVEQIFAYAAVGGISAATLSGTIVIPDQLIDYTHSRPSTFYDAAEGVEFVDFTEPYAPALRACLIRAARNLAIDVVDQGTYGATQGPRLESAAEIRRLARDGCTIVGMTGMPEAGLAREAGISYATLAIVANKAAGLSTGEISTADIARVLQTRQAVAARLITEAVRLTGCS